MESIRSSTVQDANLEDSFNRPPEGFLWKAVTGFLWKAVTYSRSQGDLFYILKLIFKTFANITSLKDLFLY